VFLLIHEYINTDNFLLACTKRGGFYPGVFFPKLAATIDRFYNKFESVFYLKPFSDKGVYGWLYRVYPEPWQVFYEDVKPGKDGNPGE
jgi:hypothetical protein